MESSESEEGITIVCHDAIATLSINRAKRKNALRKQDWAAIRETLRALKSDAQARVVLIAGQPGIFSAGNEIRPKGSPGPASGIADINEVILELYQFPKPTIAVVEGPCIGAAWSLALSCDMIIADKRAYFEVAFASRGFLMDAGISWFLCHQVGRFEATRLHFTDARYTADEAVARGLATELTETDRAMQRATEIAEQLTKAPATSMALSKAGMRRAMACSLEMALREEEKEVLLNKLDPEVSEARARFAARFSRSPRS